MEGDYESDYAHYALQKLHILPSIFVNLSAEEKAFIIASIDLRTEKEKELAEKAKER